MNKVTKIVIVISILSISVGFFNIFLFRNVRRQIEITTAVSPVNSSIFSLGINRKYSISVEGNSYARGYGSGEVSIISVTSTFRLTYMIYFSFEGDSMIEEIYLFDFHVPKSGNYRIEYIPIENDLQSGVVNIKLSESLVQSLIGVNEDPIILFGIIGLVFSIVVTLVHRFLTKSPLTSTSNTENSLSIKNDNIQYPEDRFRFDPPENFYTEVECPTCGNKSNGMYCEQCGTYLRD